MLTTACGEFACGEFAEREFLFDLRSAFDVSNADRHRRIGGFPIDRNDSVILAVVGRLADAKFVFGGRPTGMELIETAAGEVINRLGRLAFDCGYLRPVTIAADEHQAVWSGGADQLQHSLSFERKICPAFLTGVGRDKLNT